MRQRKPLMSTEPIVARRVWLALRDDTGSAALEFITVGVVLLVPFVYLILTLGAVQGQLLGAEAAARHAARLMSTATDAADAEHRASLAVATAIDEYGMQAEAVNLQLRCAPVGATCPSAGAVVVVTVTTQVSLPFVPSIFGLSSATAIPLEASAAGKVAMTWGAP